MYWEPGGHHVCGKGLQPPWRYQYSHSRRGFPASGMVLVLRLVLAKFIPVRHASFLSLLTICPLQIYSISTCFILQSPSVSKEPAVKTTRVPRLSGSHHPPRADNLLPRLDRADDLPGRKIVRIDCVRAPHYVALHSPSGNVNSARSFCQYHSVLYQLIFTYRAQSYFVNYDYCLN